MGVAAEAMATRRRSDPGRRLVLALPLALAPVAALSRGPGVEWGVVHGSVHAPMPEGLAISPRALDDRPENLRILRKLGDALRQAGRRYQAAGAPLALNFDTEVERVPQRLHRGVPDTRGRVKFAISMTIDEAASGRRFWSGEAYSNSSMFRPAPPHSCCTRRISASGCTFSVLSIQSPL
jgi:hypothetical protein